MGVAVPAPVMVMLWLVAVRSEMGVGMGQSASVAMQIAAKRVVCHRATHPLQARYLGDGQATAVRSR